MQWRHIYQIKIPIPKTHSIKIPRLKNCDIEIQGIKHCDIKKQTTKSQNRDPKAYFERTNSHKIEISRLKSLNI